MTIKLPHRPKLWFVKVFPTNRKKRSFFQKTRSWFRHYRKFCYRQSGQIAMF